MAREPVDSIPVVRVHVVRVKRAYSFTASASHNLTTLSYFTPLNRIHYTTHKYLVLRLAIPSMATPTPPGTIIEALKQGNAVELELVKKMEEGLRFITVGLKRECFNRGDALSELRESLPTVICGACSLSTQY